MKQFIFTFFALLLVFSLNVAATFVPQTIERTPTSAVKTTISAANSDAEPIGPAPKKAKRWHSELNIPALISFITGALAAVGTIGLLGATSTFTAILAPGAILIILGVLAACAAIFGIIALRSMKERPHLFHGRTLALAGLIMGMGAAVLLFIGISMLSTSL